MKNYFFKSNVALLGAALLLSSPAVSPVAADSTGPLGFGPAEVAQAMETDRPDFTEGTQTVTPGHLQLEAGYTFTYDDQDGERFEEHSGPEALLRVGLLDDLELRLGWQAFVSGETRSTVAGQRIEETAEGIGDLSIGFKHHMYDQEDLMPSLSFIVELGLPTGDTEVSEREVQPSFKLLWAYDLSDAFSLAGNANFDAPVENNERFFESSFSLVLGASVTENVGSYLEYFGFFPNSDAPSRSSTHFINGGLTYMLNENLQLDALVGFGLSDKSVDFFTGGGVSLRI